MHLTQFVDILVETKTDDRCLYRGTCLQRLFERTEALREVVDLAIRPCTERQSFCMVLPEHTGKCYPEGGPYLQSHVHCTREGT